MKNALGRPLVRRKEGNETVPIEYCSVIAAGNGAILPLPRADDLKLARHEDDPLENDMDAVGAKRAMNGFG